MLDMGFAPQLKRIMTGVPRERQTMLFSATMPQSILTLAQSYMKLPLRIEIAPPGTDDRKDHPGALFYFQKRTNRACLKNCCTIIADRCSSSRARSMAQRRSPRRCARSATPQPNSTPTARSANAVKRSTGSSNGKYRVLIATDIAARGIDVKGIELVINYDLPDNPEDYVHRIGRTGRAGAVGHAISFATPDQRGDVYGIERLMRTKLPLSKTPELPPARAEAYVPREITPYRRGMAGGTSHGVRSTNSTSMHGSRPPAYGGSGGPARRPAFNRPAYGSAKPAFGSARPAFGSKPSFGGRPAFGLKPSSSGSSHKPFHKPGGFSGGPRKPGESHSGSRSRFPHR